MKKLLSAAAIAASLVSTGAYAACSADINMGGNQITNTTMTALGTSSEVATKAYVDNLMAGSNPVLELSAQSTTAVSNFGGALAYCVNLGGDSTDRPWRLPTMEELLVAASSHTDGSASSNSLWTTTPYNLSTGRTTDLDSNGQGVDGGAWIIMNLSAGTWSYNNGSISIYFARCVR